MYEQHKSVYGDPNGAAAPATGVPAAAFGVQGGHGQIQPWKSALFSCSDDCGLCCLTCWCPCITFGRIADFVDRGNPSCGASGALYGLIQALTGCGWIYSCSYRQKLRAMYDLPKSPCGDCCVHFCCEPCALCQEYKEIQGHGYDMTIGYNLNAEKAAYQKPAVQQGMMRNA